MQRQKIGFRKRSSKRDELINSTFILNSAMANYDIKKLQNDLTYFHTKYLEISDTYVIRTSYGIL